MRYVVWAKARSGDGVEMVMETDDPVHAIGALKGAMRVLEGVFLEDTAHAGRAGRRVVHDMMRGGSGRAAAVVDDLAGE